MFSEKDMSHHIYPNRVQDDFALMVEGTTCITGYPSCRGDQFLRLGQDGRYYLQGGAICIPGMALICFLTSTV